MDKITKEEKIKQFKEKLKIKCVHCVFDGAGNYCKLKPINEKDYPHEFYRTECYGIKSLCKFPELYKEKM